MKALLYFLSIQKKTYTNKKISNKPDEENNAKDFRYNNTIIQKLLKNKIIYKFQYLNKYEFIKWLYVFISKKIIYLKNFSDIRKYKKFFK